MREGVGGDVVEPLGVPQLDEVAQVVHSAAKARPPSKLRMAGSMSTSAVWLGPSSFALVPAFTPKVGPNSTYPVCAPTGTV